MNLSNIPSEEECIALLKKYNSSSQVIQHCLTVTEIAKIFCKQISDVNERLVIAGAMLHDIGRSITHSIFHAVKGVQILEKENLDPRILEIVRNHIGTGITEEEALKLGLPVGIYIPSTIEEIIVSYSDNLTCGKRKCSFEESLKKFIENFGSESHVVKNFYKQKEFIEQKIMETKTKRK